MSKRAQLNGIGLLVAAVIACSGLAARTAAQVSGQSPAVPAYTMTARRMEASGAVVVGLLGAVIGGLALARSARRASAGTGRRGAIVALVMGPIGSAIGAVVVATAKGGLGTGNGLAGGVVEMTVGVVGIALGGLALARSRPTA